MAQTFAELAVTLKASGKLTDSDTLAVRKLVWPDAVLQPEEADALFELNTACPERSTAWADFFVDAIFYYVVHQLDPKGYVSEENAAWLRTRIDRDGVVESLAEFDVLVRIMETASNAPDSLKAYALNQIEQTVLKGTGPTRLYGTVQPGQIDDAEVMLLRRLLFARAGDGNIIISTAEADLLFRLKDATLGAQNAADWPILFVQCVANHLMAHQTHTPISAAEEKRREAWLTEAPTGIGGFIGKMLSKPSLLTGLTILSRRDKVTPSENSRQAAAEHDAAVEQSRAITSAEAAWLKAKISVDDDIDEMEKALLAFIVDETGALPEELGDLQKSA